LETSAEFIFRCSVEGILIVDHQNLLVALNSMARAVLGIPAEVSLGQPASDVFKDYKPLLALLAHTGAQQTDIRLPNERRVLAIAGDVEEGRAVLLHDVTDQFVVDNRREALARAISHDLRNPLNALGGYAELLEKMGSLNEQQQKYLLRIQQTTNKLYEISAKLVDLAWLEAGMPLAQVPVEIMKLTREVMAMLSQQAHQKEIAIVNSIPDELPMVIGDSARLKQTIYNLLDNAIRYSPSGSSVIVHAWLSDDAIFYAVADRGMGITQEDQEKIWGRMWRSSDERIREIPGGGIGLSFAQKIIHRHGGSIWVDSKPEEGSTFTFRIPLAGESRS
jgi:signal transduction histidine kinase